VHMRQYAYGDRRAALSRSADVQASYNPAAGDVRMSKPGLDKWYAYMKSHDTSALWDLLHPDAVFESPVVHTPQRGRDITFKYLVSALKVLNGESFRYLGEWRSDKGAVLEFATEIDGITINGVDLIRWDDAGRIVDFKVMVRPLKAMNVLHQKMGELLAKLKEAS